MITYENLAKKPKLFRSMTGITRSRFDVLFPDVEKKLKKTEKKRLSVRTRLQDRGAGRRFTHTPKDRFLMTLIYHRVHPIQSLLGSLFNLNQSNVCRNITSMTPAIKQYLPIPRKQYLENRRLQTLEDLLTIFPELRAIVDASKQ